MKNKQVLLFAFLILIFCTLSTDNFAQKPFRVGTTTANFLIVGYGSSGAAMGDAYVSVANDLSSSYWNPAGLGFMDQSEVQISYQPWIVDISTYNVGVGLVLRNVGTLAVNLYQVDYGNMEVTTLEMQDGTGEQFTANDLCISLSYSRRLAQWFSFGASAKYISSSIWHTKANAIAVDLGVLVKTHFFSSTGNRGDGLNIGMSISNYGTKMRFDGMDLLNPIDVSPYEQGNYAYTQGQFRMKEWELPLLFRIGASISPLVISNNRLILAADALHPSFNSESVNLGMQYELLLPSFGKFFLRGGYKALFLNESEYGMTFGAGMIVLKMHNVKFKLDYAFRSVGMLGNTHSYTMGFLF
ncbi:PorV/PorQ family protein [candidate division KSB1 bacterium]|nr:PorV/PorQ family protein [candidate division KSB1 bacterium]MBL7095644.1 PorV/PorQ family protein [candidate division KSB1 bacterium]